MNLLLEYKGKIKDKNTWYFNIKANNHMCKEVILHLEMHLKFS